MYLRKFIFASAAAAALCLAPPSWAQGRRGGAMPHRPQARPERPQRLERQSRTPLEQFERMTPEEQQRTLDRLPPAQRERVEKRLQQYNQMSPEQKQRVQEQLARLNQLPPDKQQKVRDAMRKFANQPPERKQAMREELRQMRSMTPEERADHVNSPEFKNQFSKDERDMIKHMSEILPDGGF